MHIYTQAEFDALPVVDGYKQCPTGDYTHIKVFPPKCSFGEGGRFGEYCRFGKWCSFGILCMFAGGCSFGKWCSFAKGCRFGGWCSFGEWCGFGGWCRFGRRCSFGILCSFWVWCSFGKECSFGIGCSFEAECTIAGHKMLDSFVRSASRLGNEKRTLYVWRTEDGWFCQVGCFFDTEEKFVEDVTKKYGANHKYITALNMLKED